MLTLILLLPIFLSIKGSDVSRRAGLSALVFVLYSLLWYGVLTIDLFGYSPDGTYGSDASYYWNAMLAVSNKNASPFDFSAPLYVFWGNLVLKTVPNKAVSWVIVNNILLLGNAFMLLYLSVNISLKKAGLHNLARLSTFAIIITFLNLNGIIVWMAIRGLKEPLIIFIIAFYIYLLERSLASYNDNNKISYNQKTSGFLNITVLFAITYVTFWALNYLRPLGGVLVFPYLSYVLFRDFQKVWLFKSKLWIYILLLIIIIGIFTLYLDDRLIILTIFQDKFGEEALKGAPPILANLARQNRLLALPLAMLRFITGPGPMRSLEQLLYGKVFEVSTTTGDWLILLGSIQWWMTLSLLFIFFILKPKQVIKYLLPGTGFLLLAFMIIGTYSFIYYGTGDTRHRAFMYIFVNLPASLVFSNIFKFKAIKSE